MGKFIRVFLLLLCIALLFLSPAPRAIAAWEPLPTAQSAADPAPSLDWTLLSD